MGYYKQGDAANADKIRAAFEKLGVYVGGYDFGRKDVLFFTFEVKGKTHLMSSVLDTGLDNIILTHPDYKELELPVEPKFKFKVGDWIVQNDNGTVSQITKTINGKDEYGEYNAYEHTNGYFAACFENEYHIWTVQDAKDGDVITNGKLIVIFNKLEEPAYKQQIIAYVGLDLCGRLQITEDTWQLGVDKAIPATKEQRELLFKKMKEAGYQWDVDKKELRKIQLHYDIANFQPFDKVLVRQNDSSTWGISFFGYFSGIYMCCSNVWYEQCIPFNDDTKHLLGTTDMCDEQYINW